MKMKVSTRFSLFLFWILFLNFESSAQSQFNWNVKQQKLNKAGLSSLFVWSGINLGTGITGTFSSSGETKYFHQMNAMWNVVNLGLATSGLIQEKRRNLEASDSVWQSSNKRYQRIFAINTALDFVYMGTGVFLNQQDSERLNGYGKSLIVQGAFLAVFDGIMWYKHKKQLTIKQKGFSGQMGLSGFNLKYTF